MTFEEESLKSLAAMRAVQSSTAPKKSGSQHVDSSLIVFVEDALLL